MRRNLIKIKCPIANTNTTQIFVDTLLLSCQGTILYT